MISVISAVEINDEIPLKVQSEFRKNQAQNVKNKVKIQKLL
jgi:hypothetical protein